MLRQHSGACLTLLQTIPLRPLLQTPPPPHISKDRTILASLEDFYDLPTKYRQELEAVATATRAADDTFPAWHSVDYERVVDAVGVPAELRRGETKMFEIWHVDVDVLFDG